MTEIACPHISHPRITVLGVHPGEPPFRIVEVDGEVVGRATSLVEVLDVAAEAGVPVHDLDDPEVVRWVGGDKLTWTPRREHEPQESRHHERRHHGREHQEPG